MGCRSGIEVRDAFDGYPRLRKEAEELRELWLHLVDVSGEVLDDLLLAFGLPGRAVVDRGAEGGEVLVALGFGEDRHFGGDAGYFAEAELMDAFGRDVHGGHHFDRGGVAALTVGKTLDGDCGTTPRSVFRAQKRGEGAVGGKYVVRGGLVDGSGKTLPVGFAEARGELLCRQKKGIRGDDAVALPGEFFNQESGQHEAVLHALAEDVGGLRKNARDLVQALDVVLVVRDGVERNAQGKVGKRGVGAVLLVDRHFVVLEVVVGVLLRELAFEQVVGEAVRISHAVGRDGAETGEEGVVLGVLARGGGDRDVVEVAVVAIVADGGGALGGVPQAVLVELLEKRVLGDDAGFQTRSLCRSLCFGTGRGKKGAERGSREQEVNSHGLQRSRMGAASYGCARGWAVMAPRVAYFPEGMAPDQVVSAVGQSRQTIPLRGGKNPAKGACQSSCKRPF